jgi:hypothetical protein
MKTALVDPSIKKQLYVLIYAANLTTNENESVQMNV